MSKATPTESTRRMFEEMFIDLASAKAEGRKEDAARVVFALTEPLVSVKKAVNAYMQRMVRAEERGDTAAGLAAVAALQRDLLGIAQKELPKGLDRASQGSLLRRAADIASAGQFSAELSVHHSVIPEQRMLRDFGEWLDSKLAELDAATEAEKAPTVEDKPLPTGPGPR